MYFTQPLRLLIDSLTEYETFLNELKDNYNKLDDQEKINLCQLLYNNI